MDDGTEFAAGPGDVTALPSGHDAWVVGEEPVVTVDWFGAATTHDGASGRRPLWGGDGPMGAAHRKTPATIDELIVKARSGLRRLEPAMALQAVSDGAVLIDTRPEWQRRADGEIPGAIVIERNHLEWRCDPCSSARVPEATDHQVTWIICCDEGYSSSLAAASLQAIGLRRATDVIGGFRAWRAAGLPVVKPEQPTGPRLAPTQVSE